MMEQIRSRLSTGAKQDALMGKSLTSCIALFEMEENTLVAFLMRDVTITVKP